MKRTLSLILILTMLLSLAACGSKDAAPPDGGNAPSQEQGGGEQHALFAAEARILPRLRSGLLLGDVAAELAAAVRHQGPVS